MARRYEVTVGFKDDAAAVTRYQRSCRAVEEAAAQLERVQVALPRVLRGLRAAAPQLGLTCVAPSRVLPAKYAMEPQPMEFDIPGV